MIKMRIVFVGSVYFSFKMLEHLIKMKVNVVGVVSKSQSNFNTDFYDLIPLCKKFNLPNLITNDITPYLDQKKGIMKVYASEISEPPFPRSEQNIRALSTLRGSTAGVTAAEVFQVLKIIDK